MKGAAPESVPYDATAEYPVRIHEVDFRRTAQRMLLARVCQPVGDGPFAVLLGMRPHDPRYNALLLDGHPHIDARVRYVATRSPISDPRARYRHALARGRQEMVARHHVYFNPFDDIDEGNPQQILDRGERVELPPMLIMQGGRDDNVRPALQEKFGDSYRAAGGECEVAVFDGCDHLWVLEAGPDTERAHAMLKSFIARQLNALPRVQDAATA